VDDCQESYGGLTHLSEMSLCLSLFWALVSNKETEEYGARKIIMDGLPYDDPSEAPCLSNSFLYMRSKEGEPEKWYETVYTSNISVSQYGSEKVYLGIGGSWIPFATEYDTLSITFDFDDSESSSFGLQIDMDCVGSFHLQQNPSFSEITYTSDPFWKIADAKYSFIIRLNETCSNCVLSLDVNGANVKTCVESNECPQIPTPTPSPIFDLESVNCGTSGFLYSIRYSEDDVEEWFITDDPRVSGGSHIALLGLAGTWIPIETRSEKITGSVFGNFEVMPLEIEFDCLHEVYNVSDIYFDLGWVLGVAGYKYKFIFRMRAGATWSEIYLSMFAAEDRIETCVVNSNTCNHLPAPAV
jgi:hypothetical protein